MKEQLNGSQARLGVKPDQVEQGNASGYDIEYHGEEIINPCHPVLIHGATAVEKQL